MEIWLDTIDLQVVAKATHRGILHGITTNPSMLSHAPDPMQTLRDLLAAQTGPVTAQVVATSAGGMVEEGKKLVQISPRIIVKIPASEEGYAAIHTLTREGIAVMATVIFHPNQALIAAIAGATYAAPYFSKMQKAGENPLVLIDAMMQMLRKYNLKTKILAASLRSAEQVFACAQLGFDAVTLRDDVFDDLIATPELAAFAIEQFSSDWNTKQSTSKL